MAQISLKVIKICAESKAMAHFSSPLGFQPHPCSNVDPRPLPKQKELKAGCNLIFPADLVTVLPVRMLLFSPGCRLHMSQKERSYRPGIGRCHRSSRLCVISRGFAREATCIPFFIFTNSLPAAAVFVHLSNTWRRGT